MKYLILLSLISSSAFAEDKLDDFNKKLLENFNKDISADNVRKNHVPSRGPASVAPEMDSKNIQEEKKIDKNVRQIGHRDW